jgi:hypothetical protein
MQCNNICMAPSDHVPAAWVISFPFLFSEFLERNWGAFAWSWTVNCVCVLMYVCWNWGEVNLEETMIQAILNAKDPSVRPAPAPAWSSLVQATKRARGGWDQRVLVGWWLVLVCSERRVLVAGGWFVVREKYRRLVVDEPSEQCEIANEIKGGITRLLPVSFSVHGRLAGACICLSAWTGPS